MNGYELAAGALDYWYRNTGDLPADGRLYAMDPRAAGSAVRRRDRAVYRSRHLFILLSAVVNLALALAPAATQRARQLVSVLVLVAPALFLAGFAVEPARGIHGAPFSQIALYLLFAAALILVRVARS